MCRGEKFRRARYLSEPDGYFSRNGDTQELITWPLELGWGLVGFRLLAQISNAKPGRRIPGHRHTRRRFKMGATAVDTHQRMLFDVRGHSSFTGTLATLNRTGRVPVQAVHDLPPCGRIGSGRVP